MTAAAQETPEERPPCGDTGLKCPYTPWCGQPGSNYSEPCEVKKPVARRVVKDPDGHEVRSRDAINPGHYKRGTTEVIDFIREQLGAEGFVAYCRGNAIKYLSRAGEKDGQPAEQDMAKSRWYSQMAAHVLNPNKHKDPRV